MCHFYDEEQVSVGETEHLTDDGLVRWAPEAVAEELLHGGTRQASERDGPRA